MEYVKYMTRLLIYFLYRDTLKIRLWDKDMQAVGLSSALGLFL